jgi:hypothetical protein
VPILDNALLHSLGTSNGRQVGALQGEVDQGLIHPLGGDATSNFLSRLALQVSPSGVGEFVGMGRPEGTANIPRVGRAPVIFLRERAQGYSFAVDSICAEIENGASIPDSLMQIAGADSGSPENMVLDIPNITRGNEENDILLTKPANGEQVQIARRLASHGAVVVQGPPGTGKTHTIANLVGHLLAAGQTVLVTSHTAKALRVLRDQVVEPLKPLCISVLDDGASQQTQLRGSVQTIVRRLGTDNQDRLALEANSLSAERDTLLDRLRHARTKLRDASLSEYKAIVFGGQSILPSEAARMISQNAERDSWIPTPIEEGEGLPLTSNEITRLYESNALVPVSDEMELNRGVPGIRQLPSPRDFGDMVERMLGLDHVERMFKADLWRPVGNELDPDDLIQLGNAFSAAITCLHSPTPLELHALNAGLLGQPQRDAVDELVLMIRELSEQSVEAQNAFYRWGTELPDEISAPESRRVCQEIIAHLQRGGGLGAIDLAFRRSWRQFIQRASVARGQPKTMQHFEVLLAQAELVISRQNLLDRWERQVVPIGGPSVASIGNNPELVCSSLADSIVRALNWYQVVLLPLVDSIRNLGFIWERFLEGVPESASTTWDVQHIRLCVSEYLPSIVRARSDQRRREVAKGCDQKMSTFLSGNQTVIC